MHKFILFSALLSFFTSANAQKQWIVTAKLDTIYGKVYLETGDQYKADEARVKNGKEKTNYKSYHLRSVHLGEGEDYEVLKIDDRYQFVLVDVKGKYFAQYLYLDPTATNTTNFTYKILVNWKGDEYKISNLTSRKKYAEFFEDCETVSAKIQSGKLKKKDLALIFAEYDACIDEMNSQVTSTAKPAVPSEDMQSFISDLKSENLYQGDLSMMINDINQKLVNNQSIPQYLQQAVLEQLGDNEQLKERFLSLVK